MQGFVPIHSAISQRSTEKLTLTHPSLSFVMLGRRFGAMDEGVNTVN